MTAILAAESPDGVWIGCDALFGSDRVHDSMCIPKWTHHPTHVIATSGAMRCGQIAETCTFTDKRRRGESDVAYLLRALVTPMRDAVMTDLYEGERPSMGCLVIFDGHVYDVTEDWGVYRSRFGYTAIGMGAPHALTAFDALSVARPDMSTPDRIELALRSTERRCTYVRGPFSVELVKVAKSRARASERG